jgi:alpha-methylacyl-CoA racemase
MSDNVFTFLYWAIGNGLAAGKWPRPGGELVTGGSPRYQIYRTADGRFLAAAPLEQRFWDAFCDAIELPAAWRDDAPDPEGTRRAVAERVGQLSADAWQARLAGRDVCCSVVATVEEALADPHLEARGLLAHRLAADGRELPALPVPLAPVFRSAPHAETYPALGEANALLAAGARSP